jgi:hypothetical protein
MAEAGEPIVMLYDMDSDMPNAKRGTTGTLIKKKELNLNGVGLFNVQ